jgi:hypothetical protein
MRVLLKVWSSNPDCDGGRDYAAVEIGEELAQLMLRRINVLNEQKALDCSLYETYYWDSSPEYFSPWAGHPAESGEIDAPAAALEEILDRLGADTKEALIAPPDFVVPESHIAAVECSQMVVRDDGIAFTALVRHSDIYLTTAEIPKEIIESAPATAA